MSLDREDAEMAKKSKPCYGKEMPKGIGHRKGKR